MIHKSPFASAWSAARSAALDRWTLVCNHVLRAEPAATQRLAARAGGVVAMALPPLPRPPWSAPPMPVATEASMDRGLAPSVESEVRWRITPAGLLERLGDEAGARDIAGAPDAAADYGPAAGSSAGSAADVHIVGRDQNTSAWARAFATGDRTFFEVHGDAALAADVRWVLDEVRWNMSADVDRLMPDPLRAPALQVAGVVTRGVERGMKAMSAIGSLWPKPPR